MRPLIIFSIEMTHWSPVLQYCVLCGGLVLFMCLYGYFQELVIYGWFERKLSMFSTFLHFLGCSVFAQLQRNLSYRSVTASGEKPHQCHCFSMGTAPTKTAIFYYCLLVAVRTAGQGFSNLSMTQINYPAKVLFKSANPIVTLFIGISFLNKSYPPRDFVVVFLLVFGLYVFMADDASQSPHSTRLGIVYVVISMFGSAGVPMIQEHCMTTYNASVEDLLYHCYVGSTIFSFVMAFINGEFAEGLAFLMQSGSVHTWLLMVGFCTFGYIGNNFSAALTLQYGALVNGISNTFRKALTLALSFILFPERNTLDTQKLIGALIFFLGLLVRIFSKADVGPPNCCIDCFRLLRRLFTGSAVSDSTARSPTAAAIAEGESLLSQGWKDAEAADGSTTLYRDARSNSTDGGDTLTDLPGQHVSNGHIPYGQLHARISSTRSSSSSSSHASAGKGVTGFLTSRQRSRPPSNAAVFQAIALAESSDNLLEIGNGMFTKHETGTILTGPNAGTEINDTESEKAKTTPKSHAIPAV